MYKKLFIFLILIPGLSISQNKINSVYIDPGHGGKDPGTIGDKSGIHEKNIVLPIAMKLGNLLQNKIPSLKIYYSRTVDEFIGVKERTVQANQLQADLFISIHANHKKLDESDKRGFEIYLLNKERTNEAINITINENLKFNFSQFKADTVSQFIFASLVQNGYTKLSHYFANIIEIKMLDSTQLESRGIIQAGNWVSVGASMPSVLVEVGYLSDQTDEIYLSSEIGQSDVALALFNAFIKYKYLLESL